MSLLNTDVREPLGSSSAGALFLLVFYEKIDSKIKISTSTLITNHLIGNEQKFKKERDILFFYKVFDSNNLTIVRIPKPVAPLGL
jgi:hypothetical protein